MKHILLPLFLACACCIGAHAQETRFTEATDLTILGKMFPDTPHPYHRMDTARYKGFSEGEITRLLESAGVVVAFRTNSRFVSAKAVYGHVYNGGASTGFAMHGFDLYIRKDGRWLWAGANMPKSEDRSDAAVVVSSMDGSMHECLLYLPVRSEVLSVQVGVEDGSVLEPLENPFRHRVGVFGSSYTHGASTSRSGMAWPSIFMRETGIQMLNLGVSGRCKMQAHFAAALAEAPDVDAFIFDAFSNPSVEEIEQRLFPFIESMQAAHPGKPLIFLRTIYREKRNFNMKEEKSERERMEAADRMMKEACRRYKDVYYVTSTNATSAERDTSVDGTHPDDYGYTLWAHSVKKPVLRILKKYGIR